MKVNIADIVTQYKGIQKEIDSAVLNTLHSGSYVLSSNVKNLEQGMQSYLGVKHAFGVNSGTDALLLALMALGVGPGDEVILPSFSIIVDAAVVAFLKAKPVLADIDPQTYNLDPKEVEKKITDKTKAIIVVHLYGQVADMDALNAVAKKKGIPIIEDACQAIGATYKNKKAGALGTIGCFSFYPTKNLGTFGDGGLVTTDNDSLAEKIRVLRTHGDIGNYNHPTFGINSRLDEIHAAILCVKLRYIDNWNSARRKNAHHYSQALKDIKGIVVPKEKDDCFHVYHQYTIRVSQRDKLREFLKQNDITSMIYYPKPIHQQGALSSYGYKTGDFPETEKAASEVLSIPVYAELEAPMQDFVIEKIKAFYSLSLTSV
jgi:dTDP-4-amino-4,6-dideoxygalactose transaminase